MKTTRPPAHIQEAHIQTSAQPLEELSLDDDVESLPTSSTTAISSLSDFSFEEPQTEGIDELLDLSGEARLSVAGAAELSEAELEALADAELGEAPPTSRRGRRFCRTCRPHPTRGRRRRCGLTSGPQRRTSRSTPIAGPNAPSGSKPKRTQPPIR